MSAIDREALLTAVRDLLPAEGDYGLAGSMVTGQRIVVHEVLDLIAAAPPAPLEVCPDCGLTAQRIGEVHINAQRSAPGTPDVLAPLDHVSDDEQDT
jgi:hypothetical protein